MDERTDGAITHISDTALMVAAYRAMETNRADGFIRDPFAERLAGDRGLAIVRAQPRMELMSFALGVRARFLDELVSECVRTRAMETVASVGCGLDTRPWRLDLPAGLRWIEVDFRDLLEYKSARMAGETAKCRLEEVAADLNEAAGRQRVFEAVGRAPALMITEGLLQYLPSTTVEALAIESTAISGIRYWLSDISTLDALRAVSMDSYRDVER